MPLVSEKVKVEFKDASGRKVKIEFSGCFTGEELKQIYDVLHNSSDTSTSTELCTESKDTKYDRFQEILLRQFANIQFTSSDALSVAREDMGVQLKHALVSTYLMRLVDKGLLERRWTSSGWVYTLVKKAVVLQ